MGCAAVVQLRNRNLNFCQIILLVLHSVLSIPPQSIRHFPPSRLCRRQTNRAVCFQ
jgi:hypothetical protein